MVDGVPDTDVYHWHRLADKDGDGEVNYPALPAPKTSGPLPFMSTESGVRIECRVAPSSVAIHYLPSSPPNPPRLLTQPFIFNTSFLQITGAEARDFFFRTGLQRQTLSQIWQQAIKNHNGGLGEPQNTQLACYHSLLSE